jgi:hypothetical protein
MYKDFYPFYAAYANPMFFDGEKVQEEEFSLMKSYYPETARKIQEIVEEECQLLDYEGSRLYDEYPDKYMLYHLCQRIHKAVEPQAQAQSVPDGLLDDLIQVLLYQEISRRRCRRHRCRGYY